MNFKFLAFLLSALLVSGIYCQDCAPGDSLCSGPTPTSKPVSAPKTALTPSERGPKAHFGPLSDAPTDEPSSAKTPTATRTIAPASTKPTAIGTLGSPSIYSNLLTGKNFTDPAYNTVIASESSSGSQCDNLQPSALQGLMKIDECLYFRKMINYINQSYDSNESQLWRALLSQNTNVTIFCPTNLAIEKWCNATFPDNTIEECISDPQNGRMTEYLILPGEYSLDDIKSAQPLFESLTTLSEGLAIQWAKCGDITQAKLRATTNSTGTYLQGGVGQAALLPNQSNYQACGTYIHIIDEVLTPCPFYGNPQTRGCGAVWDQMSAQIGDNNVTYQQLIQNTKMYQDIMLDVAWVGTAFPPSLDALNKFIQQLQDDNIVAGSSDPMIQDILEQVLQLHFTNGSLIYVSGGYATEYTGGGGTTTLAPSAQKQKNNILVQSLATNFSICPNKIGVNQTYLLVTISQNGNGNAQVADYGYGNITGTINQPDSQGCSQVIQMIDTVLLPCKLQQLASTSSLIPSSGSSSGNAYSSLQGSDSLITTNLQPQLILAFFMTLLVLCMY